MACVVHLGSEKLYDVKICHLIVVLDLIKVVKLIRFLKGLVCFIGGCNKCYMGWNLTCSFF